MKNWDKSHAKPEMVVYRYLILAWNWSWVNNVDTIKVMGQCTLFHLGVSTSRVD